MIEKFAGNIDQATSQGSVTLYFSVPPSDAEAKLVGLTIPEIHGDDEDAKGTFAEVVDAYLHPPE